MALLENSRKRCFRSKKVLPVGAGPKRLLAESLKNRKDGIEVGVDGQEYIACVEPEKLAHWERALYDDYSSTVNYKALFYAVPTALTSRSRRSSDKRPSCFTLPRWKTPANSQKAVTGNPPDGPRIRESGRQLPGVLQSVGANLFSHTNATSHCQEKQSYFCMHCRTHFIGQKAIRDNLWDNSET